MGDHPEVRGCVLPLHLHYSVTDHTWVQVQDDGTARVGMTDVAQNLAGPLLHAKPKKVGASQAGVSFGEGSDFSGAKIRGVAGRDLRRGAGAAQAPDGEAPVVDFGKKGKFAQAEVEEVAGRDVVEG